MYGNIESVSMTSVSQLFRRVVRYAIVMPRKMMAMIAVVLKRYVFEIAVPRLEKIVR
jgi:hypothetical protein